MTLGQLEKKPEAANFVSVASQFGKLERLPMRFYASQAPFSWSDLLDKPSIFALERFGQCIVASCMIESDCVDGRNSSS